MQKKVVALLVLFFATASGFALDFQSPFKGKTFSLDRAIQLAKLKSNQERLEQVQKWGVEVVLVDIGRWTECTFLDDKAVDAKDLKLIRDLYDSNWGAGGPSGTGVTFVAFYVDNTAQVMSKNGELLAPPFEGKPFFLLNTLVKDLRPSTIIHEFLHHERFLAAWDKRVTDRAGDDADFWTKEQTRVEKMAESRKDILVFKGKKERAQLETAKDVKKNEAFIDALAKIHHYSVAQNYVVSLNELDVYAATLEVYQAANVEIDVGHDVFGMYVHLLNNVAGQETALFRHSKTLAHRFADSLSDSAKLHMEKVIHYEDLTRELGNLFADYLEANKELIPALQKAIKERKGATP